MREKTKYSTRIVVVTAQIEPDIMTYLRWTVLLTLGLLSAGISTANNCEEAARSASGPTIGLDAGGPPVTVDVECHFTSATSGQATTVVSSDPLTVAASLNGTLLTLNPGNVQNTTTATVTVTRGIESYAIDVAVTAENQPPTVHSPLRDTTLASHGYMTSYSLSDTFIDPEGSQLSYSVTSSDPTTVGGSFYYSSLRVTTGEVTATTKDSLFVTATDPGALSAKDTLVVTVTPNVAPSKYNDIPDTELPAGGTTASYTLSAYFSDPDGTPEDLTYGATTSEPDTVSADIEGGVLTVTTKNVTEPGKSTITVTATDPGRSSVSDEFVVSVTEAPTCEIMVDPSIPDVSLGTGGSRHEVTLANHFSGSNCGELSYADPTSSAPGVATATIADGTLKVTSGSTPGTARITVEATGSGGISESTTFDVRVTSGCAIDVTPIPDVPLVSGGSRHEVTLANHFSGSNCGELSYADPTSSAPSVATAAIADGVLTVTSGTTLGTATITVEATGSGGISASASFDVRVQNNEAPVTEDPINDIVVQPDDDDEEFSVVSYFSDPENEALTYTANSSAPGIVTASMGTGENAGTLTLSDYSAGTSTITVTAEDPHEATAAQAFSFTVCGIPTAGMIPDQVLLLGNDAEIDLDDYFSDPNGGELSYTTTRTGVLVTLELSNDNTLTIESDVVGSATVLVTATNDCDSSSDPQPIGVTVRGVPVAQGTMPDRSLTVNGSPLSFDVASYFSDPDEDELTYSVSLDYPVRARIPDIVTASMSGSTLTLTPLSTRDKITVIVTATDSDGSASQSFVVTIAGGF